MNVHVSQLDNVRGYQTAFNNKRNFVFFENACIYKFSIFYVMLYNCNKCSYYICPLWVLDWWINKLM